MNCVMVERALHGDDTGFSLYLFVDIDGLLTRYARMRNHPSLRIGYVSQHATYHIHIGMLSAITWLSSHLRTM
jgi:hypothetical protein